MQAMQALTFHEERNLDSWRLLCIIANLTKYLAWNHFRVTHRSYAWGNCIGDDVKISVGVSDHYFRRIASGLSLPVVTFWQKPLLVITISVYTSPIQL